mmetsp:Transcript_22058/g.20053  ORF Transcript_22058/g.20053 Transcript_22058/m.20053 type:complete len:185 (-) Transcript_22058:29-583(-)
MKIPLSTLFLLTITNLPYNYSYSSNKDTKDDKDISFISKLAKQGKEALFNVDPDFEKTFTSILSVDKASKSVHELFESGLPGQLGYGFMMGYSSGYCLKKLSRVIAFAVGGVFITVQFLSYHGYMNVNYDKFEKDVEKMFDINQDGKVDDKDATLAYNKINKVLGYHLPTGGGFTAGLIAGFRT